MLNDANNQLLALKGLNFRGQAISCRHCGWAGKAGQLTVPLKALAQGVRYSCPNCCQSVAYHDGLTAEEVEAGIEQVKRLLDQELSAAMLTRASAETPLTRNNARKVRELLPS